MSEKQRMGGWMQTYLGGQIYPLDPHPSELDIQDIAHSLSMQCRFNGHTKRFYSVAEHCCHVSDILPEPLKLAGLLHDASEAYLCDLPRPIKQTEGFADIYRQAESALERMIAIRFGFEYPYEQAIHEADEKLLWTEAIQLMSPLHPDWPVGEQIAGLMLSCWSPNQAENHFYARYLLLTEGANK